MSRKKSRSFLDEDNTFTRGVKRGASWAVFVKSHPSVVFGLRLFFVVVGLFLVLRILGVL